MPLLQNEPAREIRKHFKALAVLVFSIGLMGCNTAPRGSTADQRLLLDAQTNGVPEVLLALEGGANVNFTASDGRTPLLLSAKRPDPKVAELLLARGARPDVRDSLGDTPLHSAVFANHANLVSQLIAAGADQQARNSLGLIPIQMADVRKTQTSLRELLTISRSDRNLVSMEALQILATLKSSDVKIVHAAIYHMTVVNPDPRPVVNIAFKLWNDEMEQLLIRIMIDAGSIEMAEQLLNSKNENLSNAARTWAKKNNLSVCRGPRFPGMPCVPLLNFDAAKAE